MKFLTLTGLSYFFGRINTLFQRKEAGKGLSTNDLTNELKAQIEKVAGIETQVTNLVNVGGEPNVIETVKVNGTALTVNGKAVDVQAARVGANAYGDNQLQWIDISDPYQGSGQGAFIRFTKTANGLECVGENGGGTAQGITVNLPDETRVNALISAALAEGIGGVTQFRYLPVDALPATGEAGVIYLVPNSGNAPNIKDEYIWINKGATESPDYAFELLGTTEMDLSGYLQTTDVEAITTAEIDEITGAATP